MATQTLNTRIILRNDTSANWELANPIPKKGEICLETDTQKYKVGDGATAYNELTHYVHLPNSKANALDTLIEMLVNGQFGNVDDVQVNGESIVDDSKVANVIIASLQFSDSGLTTDEQSLNQSVVTLHNVSRTGDYNDLLNKLQVVDNLDSQDTNSALSANQGRLLKNMVQSVAAAETYATISEMVTALNATAQNDINVGANLFIQALEVPDFWIYGVSDTSVPYTYTTDQALIDAVKANGSVQIGYYVISLLETAKVDLSDYVTLDTFNAAIEELNNLVVDLTNRIATIEGQNLDERVSSIENDETILRSIDFLILDCGGAEEYTSQPSYSTTFADNSWEAISTASSEISSQGLTSEEVYATYGWNIGDTKTETLTTGETITLRIIGFNHDDLSDGTGKAGITMQMVDCLVTTYSMNSGGTNAGGWGASLMRTTTLPTIKATLSSELQSVIKLVDKKAANGGGSNYSATETLSDDLFLLAGIEIFGSQSSYGYAKDGANEGTQYEYWVGKAAADRIKKYDSDADGVPETATNWWERSSAYGNTDSFCFVYMSGSADYTNADLYRGVAFGFCI